MVKQRSWLKQAAYLTIGATASFAATSIAVYQTAMKIHGNGHARTKERTLFENTAADNRWFYSSARREWSEVTVDGLVLHASFLAAEDEDSNRAVILAHGLHHSREQMIPYACLFHDLGYHVLMPDARAHGDSGGSTIGYGWLDRADYHQWIDRLVKTVGPDSRVVLMGVSMGAATVMAVSGDQLPKNVKAVIEDSGYASVLEEGKFRLWHKYHVPSHLLMLMADHVAGYEAGYRLAEGDILGQVKKSTLPMLMFHGTADATVPVSNAYELYDAKQKGPKTLYIARDVPHIATYAERPVEYRRLLKAFLSKYVD